MFLLSVLVLLEELLYELGNYCSHIWTVPALSYRQQAPPGIFVSGCMGNRLPQVAAVLFFFFFSKPLSLLTWDGVDVIM